MPDQQRETYIFSGLGADERVFQKMNWGNKIVQHIRWIEPKPNEFLQSYSSRICEQITGDRPVLIGISFGGIVAQEVARQIETSAIVLIASVKSRRELPFYFRWAGSLGLHNLIPTSVMKQPNALTNWFFGVRSSFEKKVIKDILDDTSPTFLQWAIHTIVNWQQQKPITGTFHIHGTSDRILPISFVSCDRRILNGSHLLPLSHPEELSEIISSHLESGEMK